MNIFKRSTPDAVKVFRETLAENQADRVFAKAPGEQVEALKTAAREACTALEEDATPETLAKYDAAERELALTKQTLDLVSHGLWVGIQNRIAARSLEPTRSAVAAIVSELEAKLETLLARERDTATDLDVPFEPSGASRGLTAEVNRLKSLAKRLDVTPPEETSAQRFQRVNGIAHDVSEFLG